MIGLSLAVAFVTAVTSISPLQVTRVSDDAKAIDRVIEISRGHDVPKDIIKRLVNEDLDTLRGRHADDTYDFASYERLEASRTHDSFSVEPSGEDKLTRVESKGDFVYRVLLEMPNRRMLVTKNRPVFVDHLEVESIPMGSNGKKTKTVDVKAWLQPGGNKVVDLDEIDRHTTVRLFARTDANNGYGNIDVALIQARVFDNPDSPYADAVASAKSILKALDHDDNATMRAMAQRIVADLQRPAASPASSTIEVSAPADIQTELVAIEDLLTGSETERRQGVDRLHQLIRRLRH